MRSESSEQRQMVSVTGLLEVIDPARLTEETKDSLQLIGPFLALGLTYREISERTGRSEDWVAARVLQARREIVGLAAEHAAELERGLRQRVDRLREELGL